MQCGPWRFSHTSSQKFHSPQRFSLASFERCLGHVRSKGGRRAFMHFVSNFQINCLPHDDAICSKFIESQGRTSSGFRMQQSVEMDLIEKEKAEKAALRRRRQQGVAAGTSRFAELEQAVQEIRINTLQVLKTPYYRNCKSARNIRRVGMRVIRELCKQMRSETVTIGKERRERGDGSAAKRRKAAAAQEQAGLLGMPSTPASQPIDNMVGGSPAGVNFVLLPQNNPPVITELSDSP